MGPEFDRVAEAFLSDGAGYVEQQKDRAAGGDRDAMFALGLLDANLLVVFNEPGRYMMAAAEAGHSRAQLFVCKIFLQQPGFDRAMGHRWCEIAARTEPRALVILGSAYRQGIGVERSLASAENLYSRAIAGGVETGHYGLGRVAENRGDFSGAGTHYYRGVLAGCVQSGARLGKLFDTPGQLGPSRSEAGRWYRWAAERQFGYAMVRLVRYLVAESMFTVGYRTPFYRDKKGRVLVRRDAVFAADEGARAFLIEAFAWIAHIEVRALASAHQFRLDRHAWAMVEPLARRLRSELSAREQADANVLAPSLVVDWEPLTWWEF